MCGCEFWIGCYVDDVVLVDVFRSVILIFIVYDIGLYKLFNCIKKY